MNIKVQVISLNLPSFSFAANPPSKESEDAAHTLENSRFFLHEN